MIENLCKTTKTPGEQPKELTFSENKTKKTNLPKEGGGRGQTGNESKHPDGIGKTPEWNSRRGTSTSG